MKIFKRDIEDKISRLLFQGRAVLIFGPRQAGKTTLSKRILENHKKDGAYFNCEEISIRDYFKVGSPDLLKQLVEDKKIVVFDEAQTIENIGTILKVFIDKYKDVQIIATGSSSFDLANKINEPLTGRSFEFVLYPLSINEIKKNNSNKITRKNLNEYMRLGMYPAIVDEKNQEVQESVLKNITTNYLYKDIFIFEAIKNPTVFEDLLKLLAYQIGQLVSIYELSKSLGVSREIVEKYIRLLEQAYIIKKVRSFSRNGRNELKKSYKIYFIDIGIRNAVINAFATDMEHRDDKGLLFENLCVMEEVKKGTLETFPAEIFFWRTREKLEIDIITVKDVDINAYECKWSDQKVIFTKFNKLYPDATIKVITPDSLISGV
jgi:predicted AAA+ superfamily ATPase